MKGVGANFVNDGTGGELDFLVQDQGSNLSGGQKQAVMMARALAFKPDILLFDEPTSAMDGATETHVISYLMAHLANKTLMIVTHKESVIKICDRIVVIDEGKIVGDGTKEAYFDILKRRSEMRA